MKKTLLFLFVVSCFFACSVEPMDPYLEEGLNQELEMTADENDCVTVHRFGDAGTITVTNDGEDLLVTIAASGDFSLTGVRLQVSKNYNYFPTVGRGNLPPGKMDIHKKFESGVQDYTWRFPLSDYDNSVVIASFSEFKNAEGSLSAWAGDKEVKFGNWAYFEYDVENCVAVCEPTYVGEDVVLNYSYLESLELEDADLLEGLGYNEEGFSTGGDFEPSLENLLEDIGNNNSGDSAQEFSTIYTVGEGDCEDSVELTIEIFSSCYLGEDRSREIPHSIVMQFTRDENFAAVLLSLLLDDELPLEDLIDLDYEDLREDYELNFPEGEYEESTEDFNPSIEDVLDEYEENEYPESAIFESNYTINQGECQDSVNLQIIIVPDEVYYGEE